MPLQTIAILLSLLLHGLVGHALWERFQHTPQAFDPGAGQDIILEPQGLDLRDVTNAGDDLQTLDAQTAIPIEQRAPPPPPTVAALDAPQDVAEDIGQAAIPPVSALDPQDPPPQDAARAAPETVRDVIAAEQSPVEQQLVDAREAMPDPIDDRVRIAANPSLFDGIETPDDAVSAAAPPDPLRPPEPLAAAQQAPPDEIAKAAPLERARPLPAAHADPLREPPPDRADEPPSPVLPTDEHEPDVVEVVAQPDQVVIVTEHSSGQEKKGGEATAVGLYLGKVNAQVQRSKVNPRSRRTGTVVVKFTVGTDGGLLGRDVMSSSGVEVLDRAAISALDRAAPFPPIPPDVSGGPMTFTQSFRFVVR